jgi:hypothetical protein
MKKYTQDFMSINDWANKHNQCHTWDYIVKGVRKFSLDKEKVRDYVQFHADTKLIFEQIWSMLLQVDPKLIKQI